jgi:predicted tellurium resistance membrane protein TerC
MFALILVSILAVAGPTTAPAADVVPLFSTQGLIALVTLAALEIVLGIDNIVFIAILVAKLPQHQQAKARQIGLGLAMGIRILLLLAISWIMGLTKELFSIPTPWTDEGKLAVTGRDLILLLGGLFLIGKATYEIHDKLEGDDHHAGVARAAASFGVIIAQILMLDIVFSLDSVITAVGMSNNIWIMVTAVVIAVGVMLVFAGRVSAFVERHPTIKMLAVSFLLLIGVMLVMEGFHGHIPKGYIYFAMAFSLTVELLNMRLRKKQSPVTLHQSYVDPPKGHSPSGYVPTPEAPR